MKTYLACLAHTTTIVKEGKKTDIKRFLKNEKEPNEYDISISGKIAKVWGEDFLENPHQLDGRG